MVPLTAIGRTGSKQRPTFPSHASADELIRQVTVDCLERGMLLVRVRDEIKMTVAAYQRLYESSIAYGMRKALMAEQRKGEMQDRISELEGNRRDLEAQVAELERKARQAEEEDAEQVREEREAHEEEVARLRETHDTLKTSLEELLAPPAKKG